MLYYLITAVITMVISGAFVSAIATRILNRKANAELLRYFDAIRVAGRAAKVEPYKLRVVLSKAQDIYDKGRP